MSISENNNQYKIAGLYFNKKWFPVLKIVDKILSFSYHHILKRSQTNQKEDPHNYKSILILESHLIGDVIMSLPAYQAIRERFPNATLIFWGNEWGKDLLEEQKIFNVFFITKIPWAVYDYSFSTLIKLFRQALKLRRLNIDMAIDFRGDIRNIFLLFLTKAKRRVSYDFTGGTYWLTDVIFLSEGLHIIDRNLNLLRHIGIQVKHTLPKLQILPDKIKDIKRYFEEKGYKNVVFIHPGASQKKRLWKPERFSHIIDFLQNKGFTPVLICGPKDNDSVAEIIDKCTIKPGVLSVNLKDIPAYLSCCEFFIGTESGIAHIAAAVGRAVIVLFGPQLPSLTAPRGEGNIQVVIKGTFECRPCYGSACRYNNNDCMNAIEVEDIKNAIAQVSILR